MTGRIDVHHHLVPPPFAEAMARRGLRGVAGAPLPKWDARRSLDTMDINGIETALLALSAPGVYFGDVPEARDLARRCNEFAAETASRHPGRFGSFAVLPMPFTEHACVEATYALDTLGADGVVLLGSTEGKFLGDPCFDELLAELNKREAVVFVHPNLHSTSVSIGLDMPGFLIEFLCDTTRAALNLVLSGTMEKYPAIRFILAHSGGFLPYVAWRVSLANMMPPYDSRAPQGVLTYIKQFYFETALSPSRISMAALKELVDRTHILFGSDFPFAAAQIVSLETKTLDDSDLWDEQTKHGIARGHALSLFPRYLQQGEKAARSPAPKTMGMRARVRRAVTGPLVALIDNLRNH
jgi:predicted TIM-barrel fold metal-dependent hydrolase